ncbi:esterase/lipase family protein [uncultured Jatrophihabitans sp.]|uniref:esterase/lipase family protein n=1 Tax=uncultured Jatrophihabitans sp. TaxID=1610747 RepID=UPI0035CA5376
MRSDEIRDAGGFAGHALGDITTAVRDTHVAVAGRIFGLLGSAGAPIKLLHDSISTVAYISTRLGLTYGPQAAGLLAEALGHGSDESMHDRPRARLAIGAINGVLGDQIADEHPALAPELRLRHHAGPLRRLPVNLAHDADERATGRIVVFLHGLCETDLCWSYSAVKRWGDGTVTYGSKLRDDDGWTPLYANFNTGLHISANGRELSDQLTGLVEAWPVKVTEIALVGHSLGGLVARSAAHQGHEDGMRWTKLLRHVVGLGTPHHGAPLERFANWGAQHLARLPETRAVAGLIHRRSVGIKDLRHGSMLEADWLDWHPNDPQNRVTEAPLIPGVAYSMASATLSRRTEGLFAMDLLVQHSSAHGKGKSRTIPFDAARTHHIGGGKHHFDLLADATIYTAMRGWLAGADGAGRSNEDTAATRRENRRTGRTRQQHRAG